METVTEITISETNFHMQMPFENILLRIPKHVFLEERNETMYLGWIDLNSKIFHWNIFSHQHQHGHYFKLSLTSLTHIVVHLENAVQRYLVVSVDRSPKLSNSG